MREKRALLALVAAAAMAAAMLIPSVASAATFTRAFRVPDPVWDFTAPQEAVRDIDGTVWLVDADRERLVNLTAYGHEKVSVGGWGTDDGLFQGVRSVALGADGLVYVADTSGRLQRFTRDGEFVGKVTVENIKPPYTPNPTGLSIDASGSVYVSDSWTGAVQKLRPDGTTEVSYAGVRQADDVVVAPDGTVYATDALACDIAVFNAEGAPLGRLPIQKIMGEYQLASGLAFAPDGTLIVAVSGAVIRMTTDGTYLETIAKDPGATGPSLPSPGGVSVDADGGILWTRGRWGLGIISPAGELLGMYRSTVSGVFQAPQSFAFFEGTTYVTDSQAKLHRVDADGNILGTWPIPNWHPINSKNGCVAVDASGTVYVTDPQLDTVWKYAGGDTSPTAFFAEWGIGRGIGFGPDGSLFVTSITNVTHKFAPGSSIPTLTWRSVWPQVINFAISQPLAITPEGDVLTGQSHTYQSDAVVRRFTAEGNHVRDFGTQGELPGQFRGLNSIAVDKMGRIFVSDYWTGRIQWFSPEGDFWGEFRGTKHTPFKEINGIAFDPAGRLWVGYEDTVAVFDVSGIEQPSVEVTPTVPSYNESTTAEVESTPGEESLILVQSSPDGEAWKTESTTSAPPSGRVTVSGMRFGETTHVRVLERSARGDRVTAYSEPVSIVPQAQVANPGISPNVIVLGESVPVSSEIRPAYGTGTKPVRFAYSRLESGTWKEYGSVEAVATEMTGYAKVRASLKVPAAGTWRVRAFHPADGRNSESWSAGYDTFVVKTRPSIGTPRAPTTASRGVSFRVHGALSPRHRSGTYPVRIYKWKMTPSGSWRSYGYVSARVYDAYGRSEYTTNVKLWSRGKWRVRAYAPADASHVDRWSSGYDYITVK